MIRTVLAFLVIVLTVFVTYTATPVVYQSLHGSANVNNYLQKQSGTVIENLANGIASGTDSTGWMEILPLPEEAQQVIALGDHALIAQMLTQEPTKSTLAIQLANIITRILSTILTAVSVFIILTIIRFILLRIADLPGISALDHFLGFVIGIIKGVVVIWIGLLIIRLIALTGNGTQLVRQVNESEILTILDNYNMVRRLVMSLIAGL
jgi:hypothetical protein